MVKKSKAIIKKEEFDAEMRGLFVWLLRSSVPVALLGALSTLIVALLTGEKATIVAALMTLGGVIALLLGNISNYIQYRQKQIEGIKN